MNKRCTNSSCRKIFSTLNFYGKCPHCGKAYPQLKGTRKQALPIKFRFAYDPIPDKLPEGRYWALLECQYSPFSSKNLTVLRAVFPDMKITEAESVSHGLGAGNTYKVTGLSAEQMKTLMQGYLDLSYGRKNKPDTPCITHISGPYKTGRS